MKKFLLAFLLLMLPLFAKADSEFDGTWRYLATVTDHEGTKWYYFIKMDSIEIKDEDHPYLKKIDVMDIKQDKSEAFLFYYFTDCTTDGYAMQLLQKNSDGKFIPKPFIEPSHIKPGTVSEFIADIICGKSHT